LRNIETEKARNSIVAGFLLFSRWKVPVWPGSAAVQSEEAK